MTTAVDKSKRIKEKVEKMGVFFEKAGSSPMSSRVFALLLVSEPPHRDFYSIQEFLAASKSSISNALNKLMSEGMIDYITFSGDRKRYFRASTEGWMENTKFRIKQTAVARNLIQDVLEERSETKHLDFNEGLEKMIDFLAYFSDEMDAAIARWETKQNAS